MRPRATFLTPFRLFPECPGLTELRGLEEGTCIEPPTQNWRLISGSQLMPLSGWVGTGSGEWGGEAVSQDQLLVKEKVGCWDGKELPWLSKLA